MPDWLHRFERSRRLRNLTLGALGVLMLGSGGGAVLAAFTVEGSNIARYRGNTDWQRLASTPAPPPQWVEQAAAEVGDAGFSPDRAEGYSDGSD